MRHPRRWAAPLVALVAFALLGACAEDQPLAPEDDAAAAQLAANSHVKAIEAEVELQLVPELAARR